MLVHMLFCLVILGDVVNANKPSGSPQTQKKCGQNSTFKKCPNPCPATCGNPQGIPMCKKLCKAYGCECNPGYVLGENDKCVKLDECPDYLRCNDRNATFKDCPNPCAGTCAFPGKQVVCNKLCLKNGCECNQGFYYNDDRKCVQLQDCPGAKTCSVNETFVFCNARCPTDSCPTDDNRGIIACSPPYPCGSGCSCKGDYLRNRDDQCILYSDCPPINCTRPNEVYCARPPPCLFEDCTDIGQPNQCDRKYPNKPQCICKPGHYRNKDGICVTEKQCQSPTPVCGLNEISVDCMTVCPPQSCDIAYTDYFCLNVTCEPGCDCRPGFLRNATWDCIPEAECPPPPVIPDCKENEEPTPCKIKCPPQSCASLYTLYLCIENITCEWGCNCIDGYLRNDKDICIPSEKCSGNPPEICGYNEIYSNCKIQCPPQTCDSIFTSYLCSNKTVCEPGCNCLNGHLKNASGICVPSNECPTGQCDISPECRQTCANPEPNCRLVQLPTNEEKNQDGCQCGPGYVLSSTYGPCIRIEECPDIGCNGDPNSAITACPWPCPSTCDYPSAGSYGYTCDKVGCQCKPGFILSGDSGKCILANDCKCGDPCGPNGTFSECAFRCPNQYCPEDDSLQKLACKPGRPCPSGCQCKPYYLRKSYDDDTCVLASDCEPVTCTRPFEVWNRCASECLAESCTDLITKSECYPDPMNCQPQCVCCEGYYRNTSGFCIPRAECPIDCDVRQECRPTCAVPNPPNCPFIQPSEYNMNRCNCQLGYVLSEVGGKCIKIGECPVNQTCNGDPNAVIKENPLPCPSTCDSPDATPCKRKSDPIGCECKQGYLKSETGRCILPNECKGGNPCGPNGTFTPCKFECPTNYCPTDDSRAIVVCESYPFAPCYSGCACRLNYRRSSRENPKCIVSTECCPVNCTRQNEEWNACPNACNSEYCDAVDMQTTVCNTLVLNCNPRCQCKPKYFRNDADECVSSRECRRLNRKKKNKCN